MKVILEHLSSINPNGLEDLCNRIGEIQHLTKVVGTNTSGENEKGKEVQLANAGTNFKGICEYFNMKARHKCADCPERLKKGNGKDNGGGKIVTAVEVPSQREWLLEESS